MKFAKNDSLYASLDSGQSISAVYAHIADHYYKFICKCNVNVISNINTVEFN